MLKPISDRAYFHLVYGTGHPKGLLEFRGVERKAVEEQERVRLEAKQRGRVSRTGQHELFDPAAYRDASPFEAERAVRREAARVRLCAALRDRGRLTYEDARAAVLELPLVWEPDLKDLIVELRSAGEVEIEGMTQRQRRPQPGHVLRLARRTR